MKSSHLPKLFPHSPFKLFKVIGIRKLEFEFFWLLFLLCEYQSPLPVEDIRTVKHVLNAFSLPWSHKKVAELLLRLATDHQGSYLAEVNLWLKMVTTHLYFYVNMLHGENCIDSNCSMGLSNCSQWISCDH